MQVASKNTALRPSKTSARIRLTTVTLLVLTAGVLYFQFGDRLSLDYLAEHETTLREYQRSHPLLVYGAAFLIYVAVTGLSLPGATAMTLIMAWYFGFVRAVILVSFASTLGATLAFLLSRFILRDSIQAKFGDRLQTFNAALDREGAFYLFTLRLIPAIPFFVINVVMGLTKIRVWTFWWVSQLGMVAGTMVYVYAGSTIPGLAQLADPSQLRPGDIIDWPAFISSIGPETVADSAGDVIRSIVDDDTRTLIDQLANGRNSPHSEQTKALLAEINESLLRPDFALQPAWSGMLASETVQDKTISSLNRRILVAAMPEVISPPQPILSKQMVLAFVLLGTFPILAKRLVARFTSKD